MAHNLQNYDIQQGIEQAWHGKTQVVPEITFENIILGKWDLVPQRLQKNGKDTKWHILTCSDVPELEIGTPYNGGLGNEPGTFKPVDNKAFLQLVKDSIGGTSHTIVSAGSVRNRGRVFVSIKLNGMETFEAAGRKFSAYLNYGNGHDRSSVLWANTGNIATVCDNTFTMNLFQVENKAAKEGTDDNLAISKRHTKNVLMSLPAMADLIDKAVGVQAKFQAELNRLANVPVTVVQATNLFAGFIGRKAEPAKGLSTRANNTVGRLVQLHVSGKGNRGENLADAFSAVTDYYTHFSSGGENVMRQVVSSEYGAGLTAKQDFFSVLSNEESFETTLKRGELLLANTKAE